MFAWRNPGACQPRGLLSRMRIAGQPGVAHRLGRGSASVPDSVGTELLRSALHVAMRVHSTCVCVAFEFLLREKRPARIAYMQRVRARVRFRSGLGGYIAVRVTLGKSWSP